MSSNINEDMIHVAWIGLQQDSSLSACQVVVTVNASVQMLCVTCVSQVTAVKACLECIFQML